MMQYGTPSTGTPETQPGHGWDPLFWAGLLDVATIEAGYWDMPDPDFLPETL
jgi:hypothetical protein